MNRNEGFLVKLLDDRMRVVFRKCEKIFKLIGER